jgi:predicted nucleotidyltransferase
VSFVATIHEQARGRQLRFLVIGGLAINHYGYSRDTSDLDLFISRDDLAAWLALLANLGYTHYQDGGNFIQYAPPEQNAWPVDLMLVQETTFGPIFAASQPANFFGVEARVPSLEHLLALKLHALKNTRFHRFLKDFLDVENLIRINRLDVKSQSLRELFSKYGTDDLYEKISRSLAAD